MLFAAMTHLAEGLRLNALLMLKAEISLICLVGTRIPTVFMMEVKFILLLKTLIRNKLQDVVVWNKVFLNLHNSKLNHNYVKHQTKKKNDNTNWQIFSVYAYLLFIGVGRCKIIPYDTDIP
jgi:hypothetical protein